jgi:gliding motility-associated-like protein
MIQKSIYIQLVLVLATICLSAQEQPVAFVRSGCDSLSDRPYADFVFSDISVTDTEFQYRFEPAYYTPDEGVTIDYTWRFPDGTEQYDSVAEYAFLEEGIYEVFLKLEDAAGCADSITKKVPVSKQLMLPNVFSPNGDEVNDYFEVTTPGDYIYTFRVFTRNGLLIYASESPLISWDGRITGGREAPEGVYYFTIKSTDTPVETSESGFLHLFR